jgi:N-acetyltransferase 10
VGRACTNRLRIYRYEIEGDAPAWEEAEKQVSKATRDGKSTAEVSIKSSKQKRKAGQTASEVYEEEFGEKEKTRKKHKKGKKAGRD